MEQSHEPGPSPGNDIYDVMGIGFGPANLALAVAMSLPAARRGSRAAAARWTSRAATSPSRGPLTVTS